MSAQPEPIFGEQRARIRVIPDGDPHPLWSKVEWMLGEIGFHLDPWQLEILFTSLMRRGTEWACFSVAVCCPRQNGKNGILEAREIAGATILEERTQIHSAHLADTSKEAFQRMIDLRETSKWLGEQIASVRLTNGFEAVNFVNKCRLRYRTRTRGGGRGWSASPVYFDEAMYLPEVSMGAMMPSISAQPDPQIWYTGSAVDQTIQEDGVTFARARERALDGSDPRLAYWEWSLDRANPDEVEARELIDIGSWQSTNPGLGYRISPAYIAQEVRELHPRTLATERLGVGDWPETGGNAGRVITIERWDEMARDPRAPDSEVFDPIALAFDVSPDRAMSTIALCGMRSDGNPQVEIIDRRRGTAWVPNALVGFEERNQPVAIVCDASGPAGSLVHQIEDLGLGVDAITAADHAKACGLLLDKVNDDTFRHLGSEDLRNAVKGATRRPLGDAWAWSRKNSAIDISPLVAATLALWGADTADWSEEVMIF